MRRYAARRVTRWIAAWLTALAPTLGVFDSLGLLPSETVTLEAQTSGLAQIGPIRSVDPQAATSLREIAAQGVFPVDVQGRIYPDGVFVEGDVWGSLSPKDPTSFKPKNQKYQEVSGANGPPFRLVGGRSGSVGRHVPGDPPYTLSTIALAVQNFAQAAVRVTIFRAGSADPAADVELERGAEEFFPTGKLPRGTYFVVVTAADRSARLARVDLPWSERTDLPWFTQGGLFELILVPWATGAESMRSSGTGFFVNARGTAITNFHVVDGCSSTTALLAGREVAAQVVRTEQQHDLALLRIDVSGSVPFARFRAAPSIKPGDGVLVAGFPLPGVLQNGLNITTGNVTALAGPGGNAALMQITAPIQPGNSGGPVLDTAGNLVGVIVSSLSVTDRERGNIAQNVNFAVNAVFVRLFLEAAGETLEERSSSGTSVAGTVAQTAQGFTFQVLCRR